MPLVRIDLRKGKTPQYRKAVADGIHRALVDTIEIPEDDRFQIITEHGLEDLIYDRSYLGIRRSDDVLLVQITFSVGRSVAKKKELFARIADLLSKAPGIRREDIFVSLVEVQRENWSFGNGIAQYAQVDA